MRTKMSNVIQANNSSLMLQVSNDLTVQVTKNNAHEFLMTTSEVAHGYDCSESAIWKAKSRNPKDLIQGKHFLQGTDNLSAPLDEKSNVQPNQIYWTKRGIIRLGFKLQCSRAILFRDWAEDLIIGKLQSKYRLTFNNDEEKLFAIINQYLIKGDIITIAKELNLTAKHISGVKTGRKRSHNVMQALVTKAKFNKDNNLCNGYKNEFVQTSLQLFNL